MEILISRVLCADENVTGYVLGLFVVSEIINEYGGKLAFSQSADVGVLSVCILYREKKI
ncbi:hypothetical protein [Kaarinaea lacus]